MSHKVVPSHYHQIALDIASRIARLEFIEGERIYGRSMMASEYNVSPETIRRSLKLLHDMRVVEIKPQSGVVVLSIENAKRYMQQFEGDYQLKELTEQLKDLIDESSQLHRRLEKTAEAIIKGQNTFVAADQPLPNYELAVTCKSPIIGKSIASIKFWQATGATLIAVRRGKKVILSPGPYYEPYAGDVLVLVGVASAIEAARRLIAPEEDG